MQWIQTAESAAARRRIPFFVVAAADGLTPQLALTFVSNELMIGKNGAAEYAFGTNGGTVAETGGGLYYFEGAVADVNTFGYLTLRINKTGCYSGKFGAQIVNHDPYGVTSASVAQIVGNAAAAVTLRNIYLHCPGGTVTTTPVAATNAGAAIFQASGFTEQTAHHYLGRQVIFTSGVMQDSALRINDYAWDAVNSQGIFTCSQAQETPVDGTTFIIV